MATLLDDRLVQDALGALTDWTGGPDRITRRVELPGDAIDGLIAEVNTAADALDHHPEVERDGDAATFALWTHSANGVTELDIALASRIDDLVLKAGGQERTASGHIHSVVGAPTDEGEVAGETTVAEPVYPSESSRPSRPSEAASGEEPWHGDGNVDSDEPMVGVPANAEGFYNHGVAAPGTAAGDPEPGLATNEGQGAPPAGQETEG